MWDSSEVRCVPEAGAVLAQGVQDGVCNVGTTRHAQRLQAVATSTNRDEAFICDLLLKNKQNINRSVHLNLRPQFISLAFLLKV